MDDRLSLDMAAYAVAIPASVHVLIIHGSDDATIPESSAHEYAKLIAKNEVHIIKGGDHSYTNPVHRKEMIDRAVQYMVGQGAA